MIQEYFERISSSLAASSWVKSSHLIRYDVTEIDENEILIYRFKIALSDGGHHPEIATHPHHVHVGGENKIMPSKPVNEADVIGLIQASFLNNERSS